MNRVPVRNRTFTSQRLARTDVRRAHGRMRDIPILMLGHTTSRIIAMLLLSVGVLLIGSYLHPSAAQAASQLYTDSKITINKKEYSLYYAYNHSTIDVIELFAYKPKDFNSAKETITHKISCKITKGEKQLDKDGKETDQYVNNLVINQNKGTITSKKAVQTLVTIKTTVTDKKTKKAETTTRQAVLFFVDWMAHRGECANAYHNTLEAFELAVNDGASMIETDLFATTDGKIICCHDDEMWIKDKGATKQEVNKQTFAEAQASSLPSLESLLKLCKKKKIVPVLEIKANSNLTGAAAKELIRLINVYTKDTSETQKDGMTAILLNTACSRCHARGEGTLETPEDAEKTAIEKENHKKLQAQYKAIAAAAKEQSASDYKRLKQKIFWYKTKDREPWTPAAMDVFRKSLNTVTTKYYMSNAPILKGYKLYAENKYEEINNKTCGRFTLPTKKKGDEALDAKMFYSIHLKYDANGGTDAPDPTKKNHVIRPLAKKTPTRTGYTFLGWSTSKNGSDAIYEPQAQYCNENTSLRNKKDKSVTFYAQWRPNKATFRFHGNGATADQLLPSGIQLQDPLVSSEGKSTWEYNYGSTALASYGLPNRNGGTFNLVRSGYSGTQFWNIGSASSSTKINQSTTFATVQDAVNACGKLDKFKKGDVTIHCYADWTKNNYTITYDYNGGTKPTTGNPTKYTIDTATFSLTPPTKTGYSFTGWTGTGCTTPQRSVTIKKGSTGNRTYTANWSPVPCRLTFAGNGSTSGSMAQQQFYYNVKQAINANTFKKTGYTFAGWSETSAGSVKWTDKQEVSLTANKTVYAQWTPKTYSVIYDGNGATSGTMANQTMTYDKAQALTTNKYAKGIPYVLVDGESQERKGAAATFGGWATSATGGAAYSNAQSVKNLSTGNDVRLYAVWRTAQLTLPTPTKTGYVFMGWSSDKNPNTKLLGSVSIAEETTFTAQWESLPSEPETQVYAIAYDLDGGSVSAPTSFVFGSPTFKLPIPTKPGYTFAGWVSALAQESPDGTPNADMYVNTSINGNRQYTAHWNAKSLNVMFDSNGATSGSMGNAILSVGTTMTLPKNAFAKTFSVQYVSNGSQIDSAQANCEFAEWTSKADGTQFADEADLSSYLLGSDSLPVSSDNTLSLTAHWMPADVIIPERASVPGQRSIVGWMTSDGQSLMPGDTLSLSSDAVLEAIYESVTVELDAQGGTVSPESVATLNGVIPQLPVPTKEGCTFAGWYDAPDGGNAITAGSSVSSSCTLFAHWMDIPNQYAISYDLHGGRFDDGQQCPSSFDEHSGAIVLPRPHRTGHAFVRYDVNGASYEPNAPEDEIISIPVTEETETDLLVEAVWQVQQYKLTYEMAGVEENQSYMVDYGDRLPSVDISEQDDDTFEGWSTAPEQGTIVEIESAVMPDHDMTLYAQWKPAVESAMAADETEWGTNDPDDSLWDEEEESSDNPQASSSAKDNLPNPQDNNPVKESQHQAVQAAASTQKTNDTQPKASLLQTGDAVVLVGALAAIASCIGLMVARSRRTRF